MAVLPTTELKPGGITTGLKGGINLFVSGTGSFNSPDPSQTIPSTGAHLVSPPAPVWKMGLIDQQERIILKFIFEHIAATAEPETGYRVVRVITKDQATDQLILKRGVIDQHGNWVIGAFYDTLSTPDGNGNRSATYIDSSGNIISGLIGK